MNKQQFLEALSKELADLSKKERKERLAFYSEMIDDRMEEGMTEEEAVASVRPPEMGEEVLQEPKSEKKRKVWVTLLLILGSPIWASLLISVLAVVLSLYISLWAVLISLWAVFGSLAGGAVGGVAAGVIFMVGGKILPGLAIIGEALVCAGLSIGAFFLCRYLTELTLRLTKKAFVAMKQKMSKKEKAQ